MTTRIGINGFGRMGRLVLRAAWGWPDLEFVHVNEIKGGPETGAHLLEFDSVHGRYPRRIEARERAIAIDGKAVSWSEHPKPGDVPWKDLGVDVVLECSGKFRTPALLGPYFERGVRKVIVAAPVKEGALNVVVGVNDHLYRPDEHHLLTAASCTTNCLAPVVKVIHEGLGIRHGVITTIHDVTNTQTVVDAPHKDLRRARASGLSLIPTSTGSATAIGLIYPELLGKLDGIAVRVPLLNASLTDCVFEVARPTSVEEVNGLFRRAAESAPLRGILGYEERPLVSIDFKDDPRSAIVDALSTMVTDGTSVKVLAWYDNEIGYVHRMAELARLVGRHLHPGAGCCVKRVLFVCVHNAARSRMAEALLCKLGGRDFEVTSAGFEPREVDPLVLDALTEIGLSLPSTAPQASVFDLFKAAKRFDYVISVCDQEQGQRCPVFPGVTQRLSWSFPDPASFTGTHAERLARVVEVREALQARLEAWLRTLPGVPSGPHTPK
jgi:glyceraldehyde 3-phosphate dehydrogenase